MNSFSTSDTSAGSRAATARRLASYAIVAVGLTALFLLTETRLFVDTRLALGLNAQPWRGSMQLHTVMEVIATLLALMVGTLGIVRYFAKPNNTILLIGSAFIGTGLLDGYHAVVTSEWFYRMWPSPPPHLVPWSWNASRNFLSLMLFLSWLGWRREQRMGPTGAIQPYGVFMLVGGLTLLTFAFFAFTPLPRAYYPELWFGRPEEFVSAIFFLLALFGYLSKGEWRHDVFEHWIVLSLIVGIVCQAAFMPSSFTLFDAMFDSAHLLKKASYIAVLTGLLISLAQVLAQAERDKVLLEEKTRELERLSNLDALTGIANRRTFDRVLERELRRAQRDGDSVSLLMIDIDHFKAYNDTHGHQAGDDSLRAVAKVIAAAAQRPGDLAARYGGEEFALILPMCPLNDAMGIAEFLRKNIAAFTPTPTAASRAPGITVSVGVANSAAQQAPDESGVQVPETAISASDLIDAADRALYRAKRAGRNRIEGYVAETPVA